MATIEPRAVRPEEAIRFFRDKGYAIGFDWRDVWENEHAVAFTVAKAISLDVLADIRAAVDMAIADGITFRQFEQHLAPILQARGWWGRAEMTDPQTGETVIAQLGSRRRLGIIFDTNIRTSYAAGQWERIQRLKDRRPWLRYVAVMDERTRDDHRRWHGTVLPADDPWWATHFPPNGWRCRCSVQQLSDRDLSRYGFDPSSNAPPDDLRPWLNKRSGQFEMIPDGIDPGFASNPGLTDRLADAERRLVERRALIVPPARPAGGADPARVARLAAEARSYVVSLGRARGIEHAVIYDAGTGQDIARVAGSETAIEFSEAVRDRLRDPTGDLVLHHSHPADVSLSERDITTLARSPGMRWIWAHSLEGSDYGARLLPGWSARHVAMAAAEGGFPIYRILMDAVKAGTLSVREAAVVEEHARNVALARLGAIEYRYELVGGASEVLSRHSELVERAAAAASQHARDWIDRFGGNG